MVDIYCALCGMELKDKDLAYGLTSGIIDECCDGFRADDDAPWDLMNEIDRMIAAHRQTRSK